MHPLQHVLQVQRCLRWGPLASGSWLLLRTCRAHSGVPSTARPSPERQQEDGVWKDFSSRLASGPTFQHFLRSASVPQEKPPSPDVEDPPPYLTVDELLGKQRKGWFYFSSLGSLLCSFSASMAWFLTILLLQTWLWRVNRVGRLLSYGLVKLHHVTII